MKKLSLLFTLLCILNICIGQESLYKDHDHDHNQEGHNHRLHSDMTSEIGLAIMASRLDDGDLVPGLHGHYVYSLGKKFGLGLGYERLFGAHSHQTASIVLALRVRDRLTFSVAPGYTFEREEESPDELERKASVHVEAFYEYEFRGIHLGPIVEYAYDQDEYHLSLGLHVGIGW